MQVEVIYASPDRQLVHRTEVSEGVTAGQVLDEACATTAFAGVNWRDHAIGIFGQVCEPDRPLAPGDRVEIYRPLLADAKTARRRRAAEQKMDKSV